MSKPLLGLIVGTILGLLDGASAWFTPDARPIFLSIIIGSTIKGLITGVFAGWIARVTNSMVLAIVSGLALGLLLSYLAAATSPDPNGHYYYSEIMLPGCALGAIAGFASQKLGRPRSSAATAAIASLLLFAVVPMHAAERTVRAEVVGNAPVAAVWKAWTTSEGLAKFFARKRRSIRGRAASTPSSSIPTSTTSATCTAPRERTCSPSIRKSRSRSNGSRS
jgi:hypothetical protein